MVVAELALDPLLARASGVARFEPLARFPAVDRDLSVLADAGVAAGVSSRRCRRRAGELLRLAEVKDRYDRPPVPAGQGEPDAQPALPAPRADPHQRRGAGLGGGRHPGAPRRGARDPGRVRGQAWKRASSSSRTGSSRAAERLKELQSETESLARRAGDGAVASEKMRRSGSRRPRRPQTCRAQDSKKAEGLAREVKALQPGARGDPLAPGRPRRASRDSRVAGPASPDERPAQGAYNPGPWPTRTTWSTWRSSVRTTPSAAAMTPPTSRSWRPSSTSEMKEVSPDERRGRQPAHRGPGRAQHRRRVLPPPEGASEDADARARVSAGRRPTSGSPGSPRSSVRRSGSSLPRPGAGAKMLREALCFVRDG